MRIALLLAALFVAAPGAVRGERLYGDVTAVVAAVRDGDTLTVDIAGWPPAAGEAVGVRLAGVDAPELRSKDPAERERALAARTLTLSAAPPGTTVELRNIRRGKYFRYVADVFADGVDLGGLLLRNGLAKVYRAHRAGGPSAGEGEEERRLNRRRNGPASRPVDQIRAQALPCAP